MKILFLIICMVISFGFILLGLIGHNFLSMGTGSRTVSVIIGVMFTAVCFDELSDSINEQEED